MIGVTRHRAPLPYLLVARFLRHSVSYVTSTTLVACSKSSNPISTPTLKTFELGESQRGKMNTFHAKWLFTQVLFRAPRNQTYCKDTEVSKPYCSKWMRLFPSFPQKAVTKYSCLLYDPELSFSRTWKVSVSERLKPRLNPSKGRGNP